MHSIVVQVIILQSRSKQPRGIRRWPTAVSQPGSRVRIPPGAWMYVTYDCCVFWRYRSLRQADHSSRGALPSVLCLNECDRETSRRRPGRSWVVEPSERQRERQRERERERERKKYFVKYKITWQAREYFLWYAVWCSLNVTDMNNFPWLSLFYATCRFIAQFFILFLTVSMSLLSEDIHKFKRQTDDRTQNFTLLKKDTHLKRIK